MFKPNKRYKLVDAYGFINETTSVNQEIFDIIGHDEFDVTETDVNGSALEIVVRGCTYKPYNIRESLSVMFAPGESEYFEEVNQTNDENHEYVIAQFNNLGPIGLTSVPMSKERAEACIKEYLTKNPGCKVKVFKYSHSSEFKITEFKE